MMDVPHSSLRGRGSPGVVRRRHALRLIDEDGRGGPVVSSCNVIGVHYVCDGVRVINCRNDNSMYSFHPGSATTGRRGNRRLGRVPVAGAAPGLRYWCGAGGLCSVTTLCNETGCNVTKLPLWP